MFLDASVLVAIMAGEVEGPVIAYKGNDFIHTDVDGVRFGP